MSKLISPAQMGDKGTKGGDDGGKPSGVLSSPAQETNASESEGHKNG